jgi:hypothetical protein
MVCDLQLKISSGGSWLLWVDAPGSHWGFVVPELTVIADRRASRCNDASDQSSHHPNKIPPMHQYTRGRRAVEERLGSSEVEAERFSLGTKASLAM